MIIAHVDMDAFYASAEMARRPELQAVPMFVGADGRGVVLSANYPARAYGIGAGMPTSQARRLCPGIRVVPPDFDRYEQVSLGVREILCTITDRVEIASIDEAFLDLTPAMRRLGGDPVAVGESIRAQVWDAQHVPCSVGIGPSKFVAKLASIKAKPDGLLRVRPDAVIEFLHPLPVEAIGGVGDVTAAKLHKLGLTTIRDIAMTKRQTLYRALGAQGTKLFDLAWGRDERPVVAAEPESRSIGAQETFESDTDDELAVETEILRMAERTASRMRVQQVVGSHITLTVRFADFQMVTRTGSIAPTDATNAIFAEAMRLFRRLRLQRARIRRVGVRVGELVPKQTAYEQPALGEPERGWRDAEAAVDKAILRFGPNAVQRARLTRRG
ncbi:MAG: DNA polymerase IV [Propionibacteriaceae bacterium]|nr:DNA polymerase IV [Propionibacteriaceae bacterium]